MDKYIICHRGYIRERENSLDSILQVSNLDSGSRYVSVEFDVQMLKCGTLVCYHDETMDRIHSDERILNILTFDDIKQHNIPRLIDVLQKFDKTNILLDIEVKIYNVNKDYLQLCCKNLLDNFNQFENLNFIVTSFCKELIILLTAYPVRLGYIFYQEYDLDTIFEMEKLGVEYIVIDKSLAYQFPYTKTKCKIMIYTFYDGCCSKEADNQLILDLRNMENIYGFITDSFTDLEEVLYCL